MPKQLPLKFWEKERATLMAVLLPHVRASALDGASFAGEQLQQTIGIGVDFELVNTAVADWARDYTYDLVRGITETTAEFVGKEVSAWVESGQPLPVLTEALEPMFGEVRAESIAVTEVTRSFQSGNVETWKASGYVQEFEYRTAEDELVCPRCGPNDGEHFPLGDEENSPPLHPRCRCYSVPVIKEQD